MRSESLPPELIHIIVELISDNETLLACALTAHSFVNASQRRIFYSISLQNVAAYERLAGILSQSPHLGQYVRLLALDLHGIPAHWAALQLILSTTTRVERLVIQGATHRPDRSQITLNPSLIRFLSSETLVCVALGKLTDVPSSIITTVLQICEEVSLFEIDIVFDEDEDEVESPPPTSRSIWHLDIDWTDTIIPFLTLPRQLRDLSSITHLSIAFGGGSSLRDSLLAACAHTLEILEIQLTWASAMPLLPSLSHLELWAYTDGRGLHSAIPSAVLVALKATPHLRKLTVMIHERNMDHLFPWANPDLSQPSEWSVLDKLLWETHTQERGGKDSRLADVHFALSYFHHDEERFDSFVADVKMRLRRVLGAGFLTFSHRASFLGIPAMLRFSQKYR